LEAIVQATELFSSKSLRLEDQHEDCHFIAQDHGMIVNSGFFLLRNSTWSLNFLERWINECKKAGKRHKTVHWVWDQGPLQSALLYVRIFYLSIHAVSHNLFFQQEATLVRGKEYDGKCWKEADDDAANRCWNNEMINLIGAPSEYRKIGKICLLPHHQGIPLLHHLHNDCRPGNLVCHRKGISDNDILSQQAVMSGYNLSHKAISFKKQTLLYTKHWLPTNNLSQGQVYEPKFYWINGQGCQQRIHFIVNDDTKISKKFDHNSSFHLRHSIHNDNEIIQQELQSLIDAVVLAVRDKILQFKTERIPVVEIMEDYLIQNEKVEEGNDIKIPIPVEMFFIQLKKFR
jgi:hypothetical protein